MSHENVEVVRRWVECYNRPDLQGLIGVSDPDIEFRSIFVAIESLFRGHVDLTTYFEALDDAYEQFQLVPSDFIDAGAVAEALEAVGLSDQ